MITLVRNGLIRLAIDDEWIYIGLMCLTQIDRGKQKREKTTDIYIYIYEIWNLKLSND